MLFAGAVDVVGVVAAGVVVDGVVVGVAVAAGVAAVGVAGAVVDGAAVSCSFAVGLFLSRRSVPSPRPPRLLSARCSCSAVSAIAVSNCAISSAEAFALFALSSSACIASICACSAAIAGSGFLVQPTAAPMISNAAIIAISFLVINNSLC